MESKAPASPTQPLLARLTSPLAAALVLVSFWVLLIACVWNKSLTYDEMVPPAAGYTYWKYNDYRIDPESGNLPQRIVALPFLGDRYPLPPTASASWRVPALDVFGDTWFHHMGYDTVDMIRRGRAASALQAVALAWLVWLCSRRLFGPVGGMLSLLLCALNPTILANGSLMTADVSAALFFLAATWSLWRLLQGITPGRMAASALATGGLLVSKMSAALIIPIAIAFVVVRLVDRKPLLVSGWGKQLELSTRGHLAAALAVAALLQATIAYGVVWTFYGFRYEAMAPGQPSTNGTAPLWHVVLGNASLPELVDGLGLPPETLVKARAVLDAHSVPIYGWKAPSDAALRELRQDVLTTGQVAALEGRMAANAPSFVARTVLSLAENKVLPEAYLIGFLHTWRFAQFRNSYFNGEFLTIGSAWFFPYTFAVKTPLPFIGLLVLAAAAAWAWRCGIHNKSWTERLAYHSIPFWILLGSYGLVVLTSRLNIGHRHILPLYPPLFVLCGAAGVWLEGAWSWGRLRRASVSQAAVILLAAHVVEVACRFPNYLSYFNGVISSSTAYQHLVDSSLDWGQDLPGVKEYIATHPSTGPFYLSYFGNGNPGTYGIKASFLPTTPGRFLRNHKPIIFEPITVAPTPEQLAHFEKDFPNHEYIGVGRQGQEQFAVLSRKQSAWPLTAGTYFISATNIHLRWRDAEEASYQAMRLQAQPIVAPGSQVEPTAIREHSLLEWSRILEGYEHIRQARLAAFLRQYNPDDTIGYSILVYKLTEADIARALDGPAPYFSATFSGKTLRQ